MEATPQEQADGLVGMRLDSEAAADLPGLRDAVVEQLISQLDDIFERGRSQVDQLRSPSSRRIPDAYLADEEAVENELQTCAAGIRTALALEGILADDPRAFEAEVARIVAPDARWSVLAEASRVPRPSTRDAALEWSLEPIPWVEDEAQWPSAGAVAMDGIRQLASENAVPVRAVEQPYAGWVQLGMIERQATLATRYPDTAARQVVIATGIEACDGPPPSRSVPLTHAPPQVWVSPYGRWTAGLDTQRARAAVQALPGPLAAIVDFASMPGDPAEGRSPGLPPYVLAPRVELTALLSLRPEVPAVRHVLVDDDGPALAGRLWRSHLIHDGNYSPLEPAIYGADLLLRPDLYEDLESAIGPPRLSLGVIVSHREYSEPEHEPDSAD